MNVILICRTHVKLQKYDTQNKDFQLFSSETASKSSERKRKSSERILDLIKNKPTISAAEIAMKMDMSSRGVEKQIKKLRETGIIKRNGTDFGGYWEIVNLGND
ncbi:winged helix-turn-helix domain-containing protein [Prevotella sp.]|uniref:winged helix-turn-helix domain-containing protein n=1 Tax=Prevotella sp. TaxID=59823 RepID=UPI003AB45901